jgi:hypothetical protein
MSTLQFDRWQFENRGSRPWGVKSSLDFRDLDLSMSIHKRAQVQERRLPTPLWALSDSHLRLLLVAFLENRVCIHNPQGTLLARRAAAESKVLARIPIWNATIDRLQLEYVAAQRKRTSKRRLRKLEQEIENLDTLIRMSRKGGLDVVAAVVVLYYRMGLNSVEVGEQVKLRPPHVRMLLSRLHDVWEKRFKLDSKGATQHARRTTASKITLTARGNAGR